MIDFKKYTVDNECIRTACHDYPFITFEAAESIASLMNIAYNEGRKDNEILQEAIDNLVALNIRARDNDTIVKADKAIRQTDHLKYELVEIVKIVFKVIAPKH